LQKHEWRLVNILLLLESYEESVINTKERNDVIASGTNSMENLDNIIDIVFPTLMNSKTSDKALSLNATPSRKSTIFT
jgi:hypothetical protein